MYIHTSATPSSRPPQPHVTPNNKTHRRSNGKFRSTPHRVLPAFGKERLSIPFFFEPNLDTRVEPLESCKGYAEGTYVCVLFARLYVVRPQTSIFIPLLHLYADKTAQGKTYEPILFAEHLRAKVSNNFSFLP